jgi:acyl carrier protein
MEFNLKKRDMEALITELKKHIIEVLNLEDLQPEDIDNDAPLFGEGLGLDSIDALELIVMMEKVYGIRVKDPSAGKEIFKSVNTMAAFIEANRTK